jgi:hypothetical protein
VVDAFISIRSRALAAFLAVTAVLMDLWVGGMLRIMQWSNWRDCFRE